MQKFPLFRFNPNTFCFLGDTEDIRSWKKYQKYQKIFFYYDVPDRLKIRLDMSLDQEQVKFLQTNPSSKIVIDNSLEATDGSQIEFINQCAENWKLNFNQVIFLCSDEIQSKFVEERASVHVQTICVNFFINKLLQNQNRSKKIGRYKKFSMLCRRHRPWRTYLFSKLIDSYLLNNFKFTYYGVGTLDDIDTDYIISETELVTDSEISSKAKTALENIPFVDWNNERDAYFEVPKMIYTTDIHLVLEHNKADESYCHPDRHIFISEKTYKPIVAKKPFLVFSEPYFLESLKELGFRTFHPYINEEYDTIKDYKQRIESIINELQRLNRLNKQDFNKFKKNCQSIVKHNYQVATELAEKHSLENVWKQLS